MQTFKNKVTIEEVGRANPQFQCLPATCEPNWIVRTCSKMGNEAKTSERAGARAIIQANADDRLKESKQKAFDKQSQEFVKIN